MATGGETDRDGLVQLQEALQCLRHGAAVTRQREQRAAYGEQPCRERVHVQNVT